MVTHMYMVVTNPECCDIVGHFKLPKMFELGSTLCISKDLD